MKGNVLPLTHLGRMNEYTLINYVPVHSRSVSNRVLRFGWISSAVF